MSDYMVASGDLLEVDQGKLQFEWVLGETVEGGRLVARYNLPILCTCAKSRKTSVQLVSMEVIQVMRNQPS